MRYIDETIRARLLQAQKTLYNNANPSMDVIAVRPQTPITNKDLWQEVIVTPGVTATCTSVAMRRTSGVAADRAYVAYIAGGNLTVKQSTMHYPISDMIWSSIMTVNNCVECALAFDGRFAKGNKNNVEYYTESDPWLFYLSSSGQLMAGKIGSPFESLVGANVTSIDAIRGVASLNKDIDQGLIVFYVVDGVLYYKELIAGTWGDQKTVSIAPANVVSVHAERTWDYRLVLQVTDTAGKLYEIFSKMEASGWNSQEGFLLLKGASTTFNLDRTHILYNEGKSDETDYLNLIDSDADVGRYSILSPLIRSVQNVPDGESNYGFLVDFEMDQIIYNAQDNASAFKLTDSNNIPWFGQEVVSVTNRTIRVRFMNFNNAENPITAAVIADRLSNGYRLTDYTSMAFTASDLVPYYVYHPELSAIINTDNRNIILTFDRELVYVGDKSGFQVFGYEPTMSPDGQLVLTEYGIDSVAIEDTYNLRIVLNDVNRMKHPQGNVIVNFEGTLTGDDAAFVLPFEEEFLPTDLELFFFPNTDRTTYIDQSDADVVINRIHIDYRYYQDDVAVDYLGFIGADFAAVRTHIDDIIE